MDRPFHSRTGHSRTGRTARAVRGACVALLAGCLLASCSSQPAEPPSAAPSTRAGGADDSEGPTSATSGHRYLDLQAHRGGRGEWTEESAQAFRESLDLKVTTLEFDIVISKDGVPVVWHDPRVKEEKCADTKPASPKDPQFPYVGKLVHELTWKQLQTLDCSKKLADFPNAKHEKGNRMLQLDDVLEMASDHPEVRFNIETKVEGDKRKDSAEPQEFVDAILPVVAKHHATQRTTIQSFDWRTLPLVREAAPEIPLVMLWDETTWVSHSPWTGDVDFDAVGGNIFKAAAKIGADVLSPGYSQPYGRNVGDPDYRPVATAAFVKQAHEKNLKVIPWTVNNEFTMREQIKAGVDGLITDYPSTLKRVLDQEGVRY